jgi:hypothetical protein
MQEGKVQIKYRQRRLTTCKTWESVRMANAEVNGRQTTREAEPDNYLPSLSKETTPIPRLCSPAKLGNRSRCQSVQPEPRGPCSRARIVHQSKGADMSLCKELCDLDTEDKRPSLPPANEAVTMGASQCFRRSSYERFEMGEATSAVGGKRLLSPQLLAWSTHKR